ncbi:MAG: hypothetical protein UMV23_03965 [Halanaerobium sp.]|nr:hypothetical protein [Halanaerobium sp.]
MSWENSLGLLKYNARIVCRSNVLVSIVYSIILPFFVGYRLLNWVEAARISELLLTLPGIIIMTSLVEVDFSAGMAELVSTKKKDKGSIFLYRILIGLALMAVVIGLSQGWMLLQGSNFPSWQFFSGTLVTSLFLGLLGITAANLTGNIIAGYLIAFSYYLLEFMSGGRYTGPLYLFSLIKGVYQPKLYFLGGILLLILFNYFLLQRRNIS